MKGIRLGLTVLCILGLLAGPVAAGAAEDKSIIKIGSDVTVEAGQKVRTVVAIGGQITVSGTVEKNVVAVGGSVVLTKTAVVEGSVVALGGVIVIARDARVDGSLTEINSSNVYETLTAALSSEWEGWSWIFAIISLSIFLVILVLALLIVALLPKPVRVISEGIRENTFKVVLCGLLGLVLIAPLALLLTISVVGIALIPLEVIIVACSIILGFISVGQLIGNWALRLLRRTNPGMLRETFWGLIILWIIGWVPYIGWMVKALAIVVGLGATLITRFGTHQGWKCTPPTPAAGDAGSSDPII
ncbi:MAG: bactofilin family protein [Syntrophales bacterium]